MEARHLKIPDEYYDKPPSRIIGDAFYFNNTIEFELRPYVGLLAKVEGAEFYRKGAVNTQTTYSNNIIKEAIKQFVKAFFPYPTLNKLATSFNEFCERVYSCYTVKSMYMCKTAFQIEKMCEVFLKEIGVKDYQKTAHFIAQIFEKDDRYRYTVQDIVTVCNIESMRKNPRKEIKRLFEIYKQREVPWVAQKNERFLKVILVVLLIPKVKKAFVKSLAYLKGMEYDESDYYWTCTKNDYKFGGVGLEERAGHRKLPALFTLDENGKVIKL